MTPLYKLTDQDGYTRRRSSNALQWSEGTTHTAMGEGTKLCTSGVIHAYTHPTLAALLNPIHAGFSKPILWECGHTGIVADDCLKVGVKSLTTIRQLPMPQLTTSHRVRFAILCAKAVCNDANWLAWADNWLSGADRSRDAAWAAARAASDAARAAAAAWAARAAAADEAARAAARAARAAADAAAARHACSLSLDLIALAERAIREEQP